MKSRILFAGLISIVLLFYFTSETRACFPYPLERLECRFNLFVPYSKQLRTYDGMYFSYHIMNDIDNNKGIEADREINVEEWYGYIHHKADRRAIYDLLYHTEPAAFESALYDRGYDTALLHNSFLRYLRRPENGKVLSYMRVAKGGEQWTRAEAVDPWENDYNSPTGIVFLRDSIATTLEGTDIDDFLRARYLYLNIRFTTKYDLVDTNSFRGHTVASDYQALQRLPVRSVVKGWAAYFHAMNVIVRNKAYGNFLLSQAFVMSNDKKAPIFRHFSPDLMGESSRYVHDDKELANLYALTALERWGNAVPLIEKIYRLDPSNATLPVLMVREISKLEDRFSTPRYTGLPAQVKADCYFYNNECRADYGKSDKAFLQQWTHFITSAVADSVPKDHYFYDLCMAHTSLVNGHADDAQKWLAEAKKFPPTDPELQYQYKLTEVAVAIQADTVMDAAFESRTIGSLRWLDQHREHFENADMALRQLHLMLSHKYEERGNMPRAILTHARYNWFTEYKTVAIGWYFNLDTSLYLYMQEHASGADAEAFVNTVKTRGKTPFEKYYADLVIADTMEYSAVCDAAGSNYLREGNWAGALRMFSQIKDSYWADEYLANKMQTYLNADPFLAHPMDNHALSPSLNIKDRYSKKSFTQHLIRLLNKNMNNADSMMRVADAMYNMTYFGNSWILVRNSWSAYDDAIGKYNDVDPNILSPRYYDYYACRTARAWYQRVYDASRNRETKAKAMLMMAQCDKNYAYLLSHGERPGSKALFDRWARDYADTRYYADLTSMCEIHDVRKQFYYFTP